MAALARYLPTHRPAVFLQSAVAAGVANEEVRPAAGAATRRDTGTHRPTLTNPVGGIFLRIISTTFQKSCSRCSSRAHIDQPSKIPSGGVPRGTDSPTLRNPLGGLLHGKLSTNREKSRWRDSSQEHIEEPLKFLPSCRVTRKRTMFLHLMFRKMRTAKSRPRIWNLQPLVKTNRILVPFESLFCLRQCSTQRRARGPAHGRLNLKASMMNSTPTSTGTKY